MLYLRTLLAVCFYLCFFQQSKAQIRDIQLAFESNDSRKLDDFLVKFNGTEYLARFENTDLSKVMQVFLQDYAKRNNFEKKYITLDPHVIVLYTDKPILDSLGNEAMFTDYYNGNDLIEVKKEGFYFEDEKLKILNLSKMSKDVIGMFLYGASNDSGYLDLYQKKVKFLQEKMVLTNHNTIIGKNKKGESVLFYGLNNNINIDKVSFNKNKDKATVLYNNDNSLCLSYLKKINKKWTVVKAHYIVQY
jgi:hypothetical protein